MITRLVRSLAKRHSQLPSRPSHRSLLQIRHRNFSSDSSKPRYDFITNDFLSKVRTSARFLNTIRSDSLDKILDTFRDNFFPINKRQNILQALRTTIQQEKDIHGDLYSRLEDVSIPDTEAKEVNLIKYSLYTILEALDTAEKGFLTGDLSTRLISWVQKDVDQLISQLQESKVSESSIHLDSVQRGQLINDFYDQIFRVASQGNFKLPLNGIPFPDCENPRNLFRRQLILENESNDIAVDSFLQTYESLQKFGLAHNLSFARSYIQKWFPSLCKAVRYEQECCMQLDLSEHRSLYAQYMVQLSPEKIAMLSLSELLKLVTKQAFQSSEHNLESHSYQIITKELFTNIGKAINMQINFQEKEKSISREIKKEFNESGTSSAGKIAASRRLDMMKKNAVQDILKGRNMKKSNQVPKEAQVRLGATITYLLKEVTRIQDSQNITHNLLSFGYSKLPKKQQYIFVLKISDHFIGDLLKNIEKEDNMFIHMDRSLPMVFPPAPWTDYEIGGYYEKPTVVMRLQNSKIQQDSIKYADLSEVFNVLDVVSQVPWRINHSILKVVEGLWESGGGVAKIPSRYYDYQDHIYEYMLLECTDYQQKRLLTRQIQDQRDIHSLRCDFSLKLQQARAFRNIDKIYFPQNLDFRGRTYPISPHLNHLGADLNRGLLEFSKGKRLGKSGLRWLKIHLANKIGNDKISNDAREKYAESLWDMVERVAKDPIANREWLEFEDCWQSLSTIFEYYNAMQLENPEDYISHIHIHQDGSCNGMQHYAALGRDLDGAKQVNLVDNKIPGDLYTHIKKMVDTKIEEISMDETHQDFELAKRLKGNIIRKTIKQTVMTTVYGVTYIGARKQIHKQLKDKDFLDHGNEDMVYSASRLLATLTLECVANLFSQAHEIKSWLKDAAHQVVSTGNPVSWVTPLQMPVVQHYRSENSMETISTMVGSFSVNNEEDDNPVAKSKQQSAFPPNYIHSLDSTHLMYTAIRCEEEGIMFSAVHDSFWTHACDIDRMGSLLREEFVHLHSQPLLENLKESFEMRYPHLTFRDVPKKGKLDLKSVNESTYFFSQWTIHTLIPQISK